MPIGKGLLIHLLWVVLLMDTMRFIPAQAQPTSDSPIQPLEGSLLSAVQSGLSAPHESISWDSRLAKAKPFALPVIYLRHDTERAPTTERTLTLHLAGMPGGTTVEIEAISWHKAPLILEHHHQSTRLDLPAGECTTQAPCTVQWTLDPLMPSDLYRLVVRDGEGNMVWANPDPERPDFAALDTWDVDVPGDYTVRIYYGTLFFFACGEKALYYRLAPEAVQAFIAGTFAPLVAEMWQIQFKEWGFGPIHPQWDADGIVEVIFTSPPFALFDGSGTYTVAMYTDDRPYPERRIWMLPSDNTLQAYDSLENGFRVLLSHEFFHIIQQNAILGTGCPQQATTSTQWMNVFLEAQARAASAVQFPELELRREHLTTGASEYSSAARRFLTYQLKASYVEMSSTDVDRYDLAIYWRFLYEQYGSLAVWRAALEEMACHPLQDLPTALDEIMDASLARIDGPFATYEESLIAFAQANYTLRLDKAWCAATPAACGIQYDNPDDMYAVPPLAAELKYTGEPLSYNGTVPASFGTDLIEIDVSVTQQPLQVSFGSKDARFSVQLWRLDDSQRPLTPEPETLAESCSAECRYTVAASEYLAVIVVRLDPDEQAEAQGFGLADLVGDYELAVDAAPEG